MKENHVPEDFELEFTEDEVLTRWDKIMQWVGMSKTFFTVGKLIWVFIFGAAVVGSNALIEDKIETEKAIYDEDLSALKLQMADYEKELVVIEERYKESFGYVTVIGPPGARGLPGEPGKNGLNGQDGKNGKDGKNGINGVDANISDSSFTVKEFDNHVDLWH